MRIDKGNPEVSAINNEIPIAPPSMNSLGKRNPFRPKPAETTPIKISKESFIIFLTFFRVILIFHFNNLQCCKYIYFQDYFLIIEDKKIE